MTAVFCSLGTETELGAGVMEYKSSDRDEIWILLYLIENTIRYI